jgi:HPt (histidine-containing phosphotransfer) domain-containing protein
MDDFLGKPLVTRQLQTTLAHWLKPPPGTAQKTSLEVPELVLEATDHDNLNLLDGQVLREITFLQRPDQPDLIRRVVEIYLKDSPRLIAELEASALARDFDGLRRNAHALKSSSAHIGAGSLSQFAKELEARGRSHDLEGVEEILKKIGKDYKNLAQALQAEILKRTA